MLVPDVIEGEKNLDCKRGRVERVVLCTVDCRRFDFATSAILSSSGELLGMMRGEGWGYLRIVSQLSKRRRRGR